MFSLIRNSSIVSARRAFSTSALRTNIAKVSLLGFLAGEPEVANLPSGKEILRYTVGVSRGKGKEVSWYKVANFEPDGRGGKEYLATMPKGTQVYVEGDLSLTPYVSEDGKKHNYVNISQRSLTCIRRPFNAEKARLEEEGGGGVDE